LETSRTTCPKIKNYDWTIEVVVENLDIKKKVYEEVEKYRAPWNVDYIQYFRHTNTPDGRW
jgi:3-hydroxyacyl-CoA dehydrogenase